MNACLLRINLSHHVMSFIVYDSTIRLWNCITGKVVKVYNGHKNEQYCSAPAFSITSITVGTSHTVTSSHHAASHTQPMIVAGSEDHCVYLWDLQGRTVVQKLVGHTGVLAIMMPCAIS